MAKIIVNIRSIEVKSSFDNPTSAYVEFVVNDHPSNADRHLHLLGLLSKVNIVLSDDEGKFVIYVQDKENKENIQ